MTEYRIVDADCHILEPPGIWDNWLPERFRDKAPRLVKDPAGGDAWLTAVGGDPDPIGLTATPGMPFDQFRWTGVTYEEARAGCYDGAERLRDMDIDGVGAELLFPPQRTMSHFLGDEDARDAGGREHDVGGREQHVELGVVGAGDGHRALAAAPRREPAGERAQRVSARAFDQHHVGPEVAFAALTALATGRPQHVDVSMQEVVLSSNMVGVAQYPKTRQRGQRRGANIGRTREIWPTLDGWVSFGIRGGKARVPSLTTLTRLVAEDGLDASALVDRDWNDFSHVTATDEDLAAIETALGAYFARHTMQELYDIACETNLMLAPCNSPREIYASAQLAARCDPAGPV